MVGFAVGGSVGSEEEGKGISDFLLNVRRNELDG